MVLPLFLVASFSPDKPIMGFSEAHAAEERQLEAKFDLAIDPQEQLKFMRRLTARPHHVGSEYGRSNADYMNGLYKSWGFDSHVETFQVLFPTPVERLVTQGKFKAKLTEPAIDGDPQTQVQKEALPPYNAYSCDGDVHGKLVYVNFGTPDDYKILAEHGVSVKGCIVLARYGGVWRGLKPKVAAEHGAVGCLIYSDPSDDGYAQGDAYPKGGWRDGNSVQRGSVADMPIRPGDPMTPNIGGVPGAPRVALKDVDTITKIPVLPLGWSDAFPLQKSLGGDVVPAAWRGALPHAYRFGPSQEEVHLKVKSNWNQVECRDVVATLKGSEHPDEWIIRGNHHDAWVMGANDPISGQVALLNEAKSLGALYKDGWKPKRTIVYCSWDGEEPGLLGSTEFVETHLDELMKKGAVYINTDSNGRGFGNADGSHSLEHFVNEVFRDVEDPERKMSVLSRMRAVRRAGGDAKAKGDGDLEIGALGSGSDFSPFLQHAGIASLDIGFGGEGEGSEYHSTYDDVEWQTRFADPGLVYGGVLSKTVGRAVLRLANADTLPLEFTHLASTVSDYQKEILALVEQMRKDTAELKDQVDSGVLTAAHDPTKPYVLPPVEAPVPFINLAPLQNAVERFSKAATGFEERRTKLTDPDSILMQAEKLLLGPGLPKREWYKHTLYAPGLATGYGVKTLPGLREAIEGRRWKEAEEQAVLIADALNRLSASLEK